VTKYAGPKNLLSILALKGNLLVEQGRRWLLAIEPRSVSKHFLKLYGVLFFAKVCVLSSTPEIGWL